MTRRGAIAGVAIAIAAYGFAFGVLASTAGLAWPAVLFMSALAYSGGAQAAFVATLATGTPTAALASGVLTNLRLAIYGTLANRILAGHRVPTRLAGLHLSSDETIALTSSAPDDERSAVYWTSGLTFFGAWVMSTVAGTLVGATIGDPAVLGLDAAFPAVFIALLLPMLRSTAAVRAAAAAAIATLVATPILPAGLPILVAAAAGLAAAALPNRGLTA